MRDEACLVVEGRCATGLFTLEWLLPRVCPQMDLQAALGREAFLAKGALVRLLARISLPPQVPNLVTSKVLSKVTRLPKGLVATLDGAEVGTFAGVDALVLRQIG